MVILGQGQIFMCFIAKLALTGHHTCLKGKRRQGLPCKAGDILAHSGLRRSEARLEGALLPHVDIF